MEKYDYREAVKEDVKDAIKERYEKELLMYLNGELEEEEFKETLYEDLWTDDSVTGNASGSYTFNSWQAEEYLCHNHDLISEVSCAFGIFDENRTDAEYLDVSIRCYLLPECIDEALDELYDEYSE